MKNVICISEENHGIIGLAKDIKSAVDFLIEKDWVCHFTDLVFYNEETKSWGYISLREEAHKAGFSWQQYLLHLCETGDCDRLGILLTEYPIYGA